MSNKCAAYLNKSTALQLYYSAHLHNRNNSK